MVNNFQLFLYTVDEYKRFADHLHVNNTDGLTGNYSEEDYIGIQVRLMLLRKYTMNLENLLTKNSLRNVFAL